ncbi:Signal transduction histidine kinase [Reichenbachiella faecimaris]|uniref:histidine kinase n=1 Tax=Reichenbachiella faecimaris TaxID=692418 RepID=A0A1W2G824_REIFA|nr:PAS domain-containing sensor histidine kinase [Reichenbachiella faecimaris]SMD32582.1 Signal transduction histidine kinase [Reichenbachiella faecimaris]
MGKYEIFDEMIEGVQVIDQDWRYVYANDAVAKHAKLSKGDLVGATMMEKFPGIEKTPLFRLLGKCMQNKQSDTWLNEFDFPDKSKGYFELRIRPIEDGLLILSFDITAQKRADEIIRKSNEQLEKLVEVRTKEILDQKILIEAQTEYLRDLNKAKDKFFNIIAHDLRSPLTSLKGLASIMIEGIDHLAAEDVKTLSLGLQTTVDNTINLTDNLIEWARIQIQEFETRKEKVDLDQIINTVWHLYKDQAEKKNITLKYSAGQNNLVIGDKNQITFIIRNLVNNAIKFTPKGGEVQMEISKIKNEKIAIHVVDNGVGLTKEAISDLLTQMEKESTIGTAGEKGTGMGLKLCFEFAKLNGGQIHIESTPNKKTIFSLELKVNHAKTNPSKEKSRLVT